jgi:pyruvate/2-oxoglutarate dehydrogenase complex dihydrolipoamide dehydrogenase (E3) component
VVSAERVLIAVGAVPYHPKSIPINETTILDSDGLIATPRAPRSLTVIGVGAIGIAYATICSALDAPVNPIEPCASMLDFIDRAIIDDFIHQLRDRGVTIRLRTPVARVEQNDERWPVTILEDRGRFHSEMLLDPAGRMGATAALGLENCGLTCDGRGRLQVYPATFRTSTPHICAAGDVIGFPSLASTSMEQGRIALCHAFGLPIPPAPQFFPCGIYAMPEISTISMSELEVRQGIACECGVARLRETSRGHIMGLNSGLMKMIFALDDRRLLGVQIFGEWATELIHIGQAVLNLGGMLDYFIENAFNYPTLAEASKMARSTPGTACLVPPADRASLETAARGGSPDAASSMVRVDPAPPLRRRIASGYCHRLADESFAVIGVEAGEFSPALEALAVLRASQQVHGHVFDHGHVFGTETGAQSGEIVVEDHAQHPMEAIFDAPVSAHRAGEGLGAQAG